LRAFLLWALVACAPCIAGTLPPTPPTMMANVYRLTEAAAVLGVCAESPAYRDLPADKASQVQGLLTRIGDLVQAIARHYRDDSLFVTFEKTKARIAGERVMQNYVKTKYKYCGEQLFRDMEAYVAENEKLITGYFSRQPGGRSSGIKTSER
jgi:hypothetical protein